MADPSALPTTRHLLTALISTIATSTQHNQGDANPLANTDANTKSAILTLHTLFPNDFLPALDLLDRGLVTRFVLASSESASEQTSRDTVPGAETESEPRATVHRTLSHQVRTAQQASSTRSRAAPAARPQQSYEVHLAAWTCSCPAFAFAAFPASSPAASDDVYDRRRVDGSRDEVESGDWLADTAWQFGGLARERDPPACKHLLACVIAERCKGFESLVVEKEVGVDEVAGWAAGWGD